MNWLAQSRKAQVAIGGVVTIVLSRLLKHFGFSDSDINIISGSILTVAGIWIHSIAKEDAAQKTGDPATTPAPPATQGLAPAKPAPVMVTLNPHTIETIVAAVVAKMTPPADKPKGS